MFGLNRLITPREARVKKPRRALSSLADHKFFEIVTSVARQKMHFNIHWGVFWTGLIPQKGSV